MLNGKVDICFIRDFKTQKMEDRLVLILWGSEDCQWAVVDSVGQIGGILTIWRNDVI